MKNTAYIQISKENKLYTAILMDAITKQPIQFDKVKMLRVWGPLEHQRKSKVRTVAKRIAIDLDLWLKSDVVL